MAHQPFYFYIHSFFLGLFRRFRLYTVQYCQRAATVLFSRDVSSYDVLRVSKQLRPLASKVAACKVPGKQ